MWTAEQIVELTGMAPQMTIRQLGQHFCVEDQAIVRQCKALGILPKRAQFDWANNPEVDLHLKQLAAEGKSSSQIAAILGPPHTRNGVIGRCGRRGYQLQHDNKGGGSLSSKKRRPKPYLSQSAAANGFPAAPSRQRSFAGTCPSGGSSIQPQYQFPTDLEIEFPQPLAHRERLSALSANVGSDPPPKRHLWQIPSTKKVANPIGYDSHRRQPDLRAFNGSNSPEVSAQAPTYILERFKAGFGSQQGKLSLQQLPRERYGCCRYPIDQPDGSLLFCGDQAADNMTYCPTHWARCTVPTRHGY